MRRRLFAALFATLALVPLAAGCAGSDPEAANDIRIYQVLPVARSSKLAEAAGEGEAIALVNTGTRAHTVTGWTVVSGSGGKVMLPKLTLEPGRKIYLANDAEYFRKYWNFAPDFEYGVDTDNAVPDLKVGKEAPVLSDQGDTVRLLDEKAKQIDILAYGNVSNLPEPWSGAPVQLVDSFPLQPGNQVITRLYAGNRYKLESRADSWSGGTPTEPRRVYFAGQSDFPVKTVSGPMTVIAASAPDNTGQLIKELVEQARRSIRLGGYQFGHKELAQALVAAQKRGVRVTVGVERNPGGSDMFDADKEAQEILHKGGVEILYHHKWDGDLSTRVNPMHAKYLIIDDDTVLVSSGNFVDSSYPTMPTCGNRDWTVVFRENADVVKMIREIWDYDFGSGHADVREYSERLDMPLWPYAYDPGPCIPYTPVKPAPLTITGKKATVTRILSPDNTLDPENGFLGLLRGAKKELLISANYINMWWGQADEAENFNRYPQPYLREIVEAARRGVSVKVLLDRRNVRLDSKRDNQYVADYLTRLARSENLNLEARLLNMDGAGIGRTLHNKSLIVDGAVVISSVNGSENSFRYARELTLKVDELPELTAYYRDLFMHDWNASETPNRPWDVTAAPRNDGTAISWSKNAELNVVGYEVYYKAKAADAWIKLTETTGTGYVHAASSGIWGVVAVTGDGVRSSYAEVSR
ncbi:MAG TPA: phospholipase D-like domain-containing protein [Symbiobacteriaceae bacterium]|nr:phospholipase D-like domain-containing protein [Symbiobacteriaceae bacterium]